MKYKLTYDCKKKKKNHQAWVVENSKKMGKYMKYKMRSSAVALDLHRKLSLWRLRPLHHIEKPTFL